jgi:signal transduction histidine kinase
LKREEKSFQNWLKYWWNGLALTTKMLLLMLVVFFLAWLVLDRIQSNRIWDLLQKHQRAMLTQEGLEDRVRLDDFTRAMNHASKLMIHLEGFKQHLKKMEAQNWAAQEEVKVIRHEKRPSWLPRKFLLRGLANARHVLLLDPDMRVREVFQNGPQPLKEEVLGEVTDYVSPDGEIYLAFFDGMPNLVVPGILRDADQMPRAFLVFLAPLDEQFLFTFQRKAAGKSIVAFLDREFLRIFASSRPELVPNGARLEDLEKNFLIVTDRFLDFGFSADTEIEFAVLTPWQEVDKITKRMLASERPLHIATALILIFIISLILFWITYQLRRFSAQMLAFSKQYLGYEPPSQRKGDQLHLVQEQFYSLGQEVLRNREEEEKRSAELLEANTELEAHRHNLTKLVEDRTKDLNRINEDLRLEIIERQKAESHTKRTLQSRNAISSILQASFAPISLQEQLKVALDIVLTLDWLSVMEKGTIFLADTGGKTLSLAAHAGVAAPLIEKCARIDVGFCLCGRTAQEGKIIYASGLDDRHDIQYEGIQPHGHYCVPIMQSSEMLGVLNLYLIAGQTRDQEQEEFLQGVADTLAYIIIRKRAEAQITLLNADLEKRVAVRTAELVTANKEMESFSYTVSHDLRAPLRTIDGFSDILLEDCADKLNDDEKGYLLNVREGAQEMSALIDGLLVLSRLTRGEISFEDVDLSNMVDKIINIHKQMEPEREVNIDIMPNVSVIADPTLCKTLMDNLIGNAWKYSGAKTTVRIVFGVNIHNGENIFFVKDSGSGFNMKFADKLFLPFSRLHSGEEFEGTGIGLATVKRIVHRHGGRLWAEAEVDKGATFFFTMAKKE